MVMTTVDDEIAVYIDGNRLEQVDTSPIGHSSLLMIERVKYISRLV